MPASKPMRTPSAQFFRRRKETMNVMMRSIMMEPDEAKSWRKSCVKAITYARSP